MLRNGSSINFVKRASKNPVHFIYLSFCSSSVLSRLISKFRTESRGNLGDFCKKEACLINSSTQACSKIIVKLIRTFRIKQNKFLKYKNKCQSRWEYIVGLGHVRPFNMLYLQWSLEMRGFITLLLCSNFMWIFNFWQQF